MRSPILASFALAAALVLAPAAPLAAANSGTGKFRLDKVQSKLSSACGFRVADPEKRGATRAVVVLASVALDCPALDTGFDPVAAARAKAEAAKGAIVVLRIAPDGERIDGDWTSHEPYDSFSFGGAGEVKLPTRSETRLEGSYRLPRPDSFFDKTYDFDFKFAVDLLAGSVAGTRLAAGGGEAGKAYLAYVKAIQKQDKKALRDLVAAEAAGMLEVDIALQMRKDFGLASAKVVGGLARADAVALDVEGTDASGQKQRGQAFLVREGGRWRFANESLAPAFD